MHEVNVKCPGGGADFNRTFTDESGRDYRVELIHHENDPAAVKRLYITRDKFTVELLPSKALSVRSANLAGKPMFWESPLDSIADPSDVRLNEPLLIDGELISGMSWIRYFSASIEMLGLFNWGMPTDGFGLHGNVSNIPVEEIQIGIDNFGISIKGSFTVDNTDSINVTGKPVYRIEKIVGISAVGAAVHLRDKITNLSAGQTVPQWGYHVQLRPEPGAEYLIPGKSVEERFGGKVPADHRLWTAAKNGKEREEKGFIYKNLLTGRPFPESNREGVSSLLHYKDGSGIAVSFTPPPYLQSWFSCGGANGSNFMQPPADGTPEPSGLFSKNWDGVGPEFGNTALDRDGNTDPAIPPVTLGPAESTEIDILVEFLDSKRASNLRTEIESYCINK